MKKTKLEVIRINEDVIATSGLCQHHDKYHFYSEYNFTAYEYMFGDSYEGNSYQIDEKNSARANYMFFVPVINKTTSPGKYYYIDGESFIECNGDHSLYERDNSTILDD